MSEIDRSSRTDELGVIRLDPNGAEQALRPEDALPPEGEAETAAVPELTVVFLNQDKDARDFARDYADERLTKELGGKKGFRGILTNIWKGNLAKEFYRQRYQREHLSVIKEAGNVLAPQEWDRATREQALATTINRFTSQYEEAVHTSAGERKQDVEHDELGEGTKDLIRRYVIGELDDATLGEERTRFLQSYQRAHSGDDKVALFAHTDNLIDIAQAAKGSVEHGASIDAVLNNMRVVAGESRSGVRTEAHYSATDKIIDKLEKSRIGQLVQPEILIAAATIATSLLRFGSERAVGAAAMTIAPGIGAGILAGVRESKRVEDERQQHAREVAQGKEIIGEDDKRRQEMETTRYATANVSDLITALETASSTEAGLDDVVATRRLVETLGVINARINLSDGLKIDLISYSDISQVEAERFALDIARAEAKVTLHHRLEATNQLNDATVFAQLSALGIDHTKDMQELLDEQSQVFLEIADQDMTEKDAAFKKIRRHRVAKAAALGLGVGLTAGLVSQEVLAAFDPSRLGLVEQMWSPHSTTIDGVQHQTVLAGLTNELSGHDDAIHHGASSTYKEFNLANTGEAKLSLSDDHNFVRGEDGTFSLVDANGHATVDHLSVNPDGSFPQGTIDVLHTHGMMVEDLSKTIDHTSTTSATVSASEYVAHHPNETTTITRDFWYDNDTAIADKNELGLQWGGGDNSGVTENGNFSFTAGPMAADGSYHLGEGLNPQQAAESGQLKLAISASVDTQSQVFMVDVAPNGEMIIPKDSAAAQLFSIENGHAVFHGAYAEVVQTAGVDANGVEHVRALATDVGLGDQSSLVETQTVTTHEVIHEYKITTAGTDTATFTEMAPTIPIVPRRSLEALRRKTPNVPPVSREGYIPGYLNMSPEQREQLKADRSPRLQQDPTTRLKLGEELDWHEQLIRRNGSSDYVRELNEIIDATPGLAHIKPDTKAIVTIPVGAALESDNIYRTLSLYGEQPSDVTQSTEILLHVNWIDAAENDPAKAAAIQKTKDEIARAKQDYPDLRISIIESTWSKEKIDNGEYGDRLIGHVSQKMYDAAMMAVNRAVKEGTMSPEADVLVIKNDADALGMDRGYLAKMIKSFEEHPENDTFTGAVRWGTHRYKDLPGFGFVTTFHELTQIASQRAHVKGYKSTFGVNAAVRMSTFAAVGGIGHYSDQKHSAPDDLAIGERVAAARNASVRGASGLSGQYLAGGSRDGEDYSYHRQVAGASIDSDADRMEATYIAGLPITQTWDGVNTGGFQGRTTGLKKGETESLTKDPDAVIERIEKSVSAIARDWVPDRKQLLAGLAFMTPSPRELGGSPAYVISDKDGRVDFTFTPEGKKWLIKSLQRNSKGQFSSYGARTARRLYNRVGKDAKIRPVTSTPRMFGGA